MLLTFHLAVALSSLILTLSEKRAAHESAEVRPVGKHIDLAGRIVR